MDMSDEGLQGLLFKNEVEETGDEERNPYVNLVDNLVDRIRGTKTRIEDLCEGHYKVVIVKGRTILHSLGIIPKGKIYRSVSAHDGVEGDFSNVYVQSHEK